MRPSLCGLALAAALTGCGTSDSVEQVANGPAETAKSTCTSEGAAFASQYSAGPVDLLASHATTPEAFGNWDRDRLGPDGPRPEPIQRTKDNDGRQFLAYCYYSGEFDAFPKGPPSPDGSSTPPKYTRIAVTMDSAGYGTVHRVGPSSMNPDEAPPGPTG